MNFQANNLDAAYNQVSALNDLTTTTGVNICDSLESNIKNLKVHWKGTDATLHINNLISVLGGMRNIIVDVSKIAHNVSIPIVNVQTIRKSNGGTGGVGDVISVYNGVFSNVTQVETTDEYYVDPSAAPTDLDTLVNICDRFDQFITQFQATKQDLLNNWTSGSDRATVVNMGAKGTYIQFTNPYFRR